MIGRISGTLLEKTIPTLLVDVAGVGYEITVSMQTLYQAPAPGEAIVLHTHHVSREDGQALFGFIDLTERRLFRELIKVNGVGPKLAIAVLSSISPQDFVLCIQHQDSASLTRLPGIGKKTAERLIIEMRDRLTNWSNDDGQTVNPNIDRVTSQPSAEQDAISALIALGFKPAEASKKIKGLKASGDSDSETLIRQALQA